MKIPQLDLTNFQLPFCFKNGTLEIGIAESYLAEPINAYIRKYEGSIRDTDSENIHMDNLIFSLREGGFVVKGNVQVQFRKQLGEAPVIGAIYTPWITINGSFVEELVVDVVDGKLSASHSQLHLNRTDNQYKEIFDQFVLPYLKNEVVKRINEEISNFNGMTVEEVVLKYGKNTLRQKIGGRIMGEDRLNTLLKLADTNLKKLDGLQRIKNKVCLVGFNTRVSGEHLWLSIVKR